ncbi:hypothetical protein TW81_09085 [Vibrio galatheae]|uniref:Uncharacterized protein n=1 Tax=Vibrio galatheae TaxID=579748 RepID=A0A0F4NJX4_9VIBR|nr:hypothetical protein TW81_09085 [Vibrio galatheae]
MFAHDSSLLLFISVNFTTSLSESFEFSSYYLEQNTSKKFCPYLETNAAFESLQIKDFAETITCI